MTKGEKVGSKFPIRLSLSTLNISMAQFPQFSLFSNEKPHLSEYINLTWVQYIHQKENKENEGWSINEIALDIL